MKRQSGQTPIFCHPALPDGRDTRLRTQGTQVLLNFPLVGESLPLLGESLPLAGRQSPAGRGQSLPPSRATYFLMPPPLIGPLPEATDVSLYHRHSMDVGPSSLAGHLPLYQRRISLFRSILL